MMTANLADGRVLNFPDGTDPAVIQATVKKTLSQPIQQVAAAPSQVPLEVPRGGVPVSQPDLREEFERFRTERAMALEPEEERGFFERAGEFFTGAERETRATRELPELGAGGLLSGEDLTQVAKVAPVLLTTTDPREIGQILTNSFPNIGVIEDEKGNLIAANNKTGAQVVINQPGASMLDLLQGLGVAATFTPAARLAAGAQTIGKKLLTGAAAAGVTETAIQAGQEVVGGELDPETIATSAALGAGAELVAPAIGAVRQVAQPLAQAAGRTLTDALKAGAVLTTDIFPPTTFVGKAFQKITERVPLLGTGRVRAAQQATRKEAIEDIAREFDIDPSSEFEKDIVAGVTRVFKGAQQKATKFRTEAVEELNRFGDITPQNALKAIDDEIAKIQSLGAQGDQALIESLNNIKGELAGNFGRLRDIRTTIFNDISDITGARSAIRSGGDTVLTKVAGALSKDMDEFAVGAVKLKGATSETAKAANKWKASNRIFKDNFAKAKETELKKALTKGKLQPEVINSTIRGGKKSELLRLHGNIDLAGRASVRQQILKNALEKSGFPENINPTAFLNELNRANNKKAINIFFKGADKRQLDGLKKFLNITRRAQEEAASIATQQEVTTVGLVTGAALAPAETITIAALTGLGGRLFESKPIRNLLIKLSAPKLSPNKAQAIVEKLKPLVITAGRE